MVDQMDHDGELFHVGRLLAKFDGDFGLNEISCPMCGDMTVVFPLSRIGLRECAVMITEGDGIRR